VSRLRLGNLARYAGSLRLGVILLGILIVSAAIGGVIPQSPNTPNADLIYQSYGTFAHRVIVELRLDDVFHATWLYVLLGLFSLNLTLCTARRLRGTLQFLRHRRLDDPGEARMDRGIALSPEKSADSNRRAVTAVLRRNRLRSQWHAWGVSAGRYRYGIVGPDLVHLSLLVVLVGGVLGLFGERGVLFAESGGPQRFDPCGDTAQSGACLPDVDFSLRIDDFGADWASGTFSESPEQYWTDVTFLRGGIAVLARRIEVNHPASYQGISFYQSAYGLDPSHATIRLQLMDESRVSHTVSLAAGDAFLLPGGDVEIRLVRVFANLSWSADGPVEQYGLRATNPAALLELQALEDGGTMERGRLLVYPAQPSATNQLPGWEFRIAKLDIPTYVGLLYVVSPGYPVVWSGLVLLVVGLIVSFFFRPTCLALRWGAGAATMGIGVVADRSGNARALMDRIARQLDEGVSQRGDS
jgi:cytochrome c biogenesis protein